MAEKFFSQKKITQSVEVPENMELLEDYGIDYEKIVKSMPQDWREEIQVAKQRIIRELRANKQFAQEQIKQGKKGIIMPSTETQMRSAKQSIETIGHSSGKDIEITRDGERLLNNPFAWRGEMYEPSVIWIDNLLQHDISPMEYVEKIEYQNRVIKSTVTPTEFAVEQSLCDEPFSVEGMTRFPSIQKDGEMPYGFLEGDKYVFIAGDADITNRDITERQSLRLVGRI